jgi:hypothetical protein
MFLMVKSLQRVSLGLTRLYLRRRRFEEQARETISEKGLKNMIPNRSFINNFFM